MKPGLKKQPKASPPAEEGRRAARRAFLTGSLAAAPLITTLASRPAWAVDGMCSVMNSLNHASHVKEDYGEGLPATIWRTNADDMVAEYVVVGPLKPVFYSNLTQTFHDYTYATKSEILEAMAGQIPEDHREALIEYMGWLTNTPPYPTEFFGTKFQDYFTTYPDPYLTIMQALWLDIDQPLTCQSACAWLNANMFPATFGYSQEEVVALYESNESCDLVTAFTIMNSASITA